MRIPIPIGAAAAVLLTIAPHVAWAEQPAYVAPPPRKHRNAGMMIAGIVLTSIASATLIGGVALVGIASSGPSASSDGGGLGGGNFAVLPGIITIGLSVPVAALGIPLWAVGARAPDSATAGERALPAWVGAIPAVGTSSRAGTLTWRF